MLKLIGPVDMREHYGIVIDAENFWEMIETFAEQKPLDHPDYSPNPYLSGTIASTSAALADAVTKPKKIIGDVMNGISVKLSTSLNKDILLGLIEAFERGLKEKHILLYFRDEGLESKILSRDWGGEVHDTGWDYLLVVNTNIAGGKSDRVIKEKIDLSAEVAADGSVTNTLLITRTHTGAKGDKFTGVRNNDWMRIYVPDGSRLLEARGFSRPDQGLFGKPDAQWQKDPDVERAEQGAITDTTTGTMIYRENGKTVFANWSQVDPGQATVIYLKYKLPFILTVPADAGNTLKERVETFFSSGRKQLIPYALLAQKQPGSPGSEFTATLTLPENYNIVWRYPAEENINESGWNISTDLRVDRYYAALMENVN